MTVVNPVRPRKSGDCYISATRKSWWPIYTRDKGYVINTEVAYVVKPGGKLIVSRRGLGITKTRKVVITAEYATLLSLKGELHTLFN